ncbi:hypothetical protein F4779DRAFT_114204 [Xylariaceae sp. FL0662B]|nr:hypothetical protein F4779DRAFT_114204 [Xylariaceae sp. FL0662B]
MSSELPFLSSDNEANDRPPFSVERFRTPKLSRFSFNEFRVLECISGGADGVVYLAEFDQREPVALKIFYHNHRRDEGEYYTDIRDNKELEGVTCYWAFERECINAALLKMITGSIERSKASGEPIYLKKAIETRDDAIKNLEAFSDEGRLSREDHQGEDLIEFTLNPRLKRCLGWVEFEPDAFEDEAELAPGHKLHHLQDHDPGNIFGIVHEWIPSGQLDKEVIRAHLDFFHITGFATLGWFFDRNWQGNGILVDYSDIIAPVEGLLGWDAENYKLDHRDCIRSLGYHFERLAELGQ